ncbi:helix-turn-helix domain-containing protein [Lactococcus protaetiae]|uniref:MarR family transcriptional regulator n=1 Tax=Lactococcus protaetiae TaxID=2592653 RepID=A0A514ZA31_9LACT|nr:helix-turn-helix domain-containing protein [Lactococcus protaetiae]QDK71442.1 MarR family transcriptional regulator [Lactococcus protaetiae]
MDNTEVVLEAFQNSAEMLDAKAVAEITGIEKSEVSKVIVKLKKEGVLTSPKRCFYEMVK